MASESSTTSSADADYLVRIGPPSKGDMIHRASCRFAKRSRNPLRWLWADRQGYETIDWDALRRRGITGCVVCKPELLRVIPAAQTHDYGAHV